MKTSIIASEFTHAEKEHAMSKNENLAHNKEQHQQAKYYKALSDTIRNYEEVILFGPTDAKSELFNLLKADHNFEKIRITVEQTDKMTENQEHAFVKEHFSRHS